MGRPKLQEERKKVSISITVRPEVAELASDANGRSNFFERSVDCSRGVSKILQRFQKSNQSRTDVERFLEDLSDVVSVWDSQFEESLPEGKAF